MVSVAEREVDPNVAVMVTCRTKQYQQEVVRMVKLAEVCPAGTVTLLGTVALFVLLLRS